MVGKNNCFFSIENPLYNSLIPTFAFTTGSKQTE